MYSRLVHLYPDISANQTHALREMCPNTELFLVRILNLRIQSEYRKIRTRYNSVFGHFSRSDAINRFSETTFILLTITSAAK